MGVTVIVNESLAVFPEMSVELAVTVYNSDIALVRDVRELQLSRGSADLRFMDIAATVNPATVHFRSLTEPTRLELRHVLTKHGLLYLRYSREAIDD